MDIASLIGIFSGFALIFSAIVLGGSVDSFVNVPGMMIVIGGTYAATLLTFPMRDVMTAFRSALIVFSKTKQRPEQVINTMLQLTQLTRRKGLLALSDVETNSPFLKRACDLIADASDEQMIRHVLRIEINAIKARHYNVQDVFKKMATFAPAFGMLGTLIGLIQMLVKLDDPASIGPSMSVALLTTFYGSLLATVVFIPIAGKLKSRTMQEVISLEIIFEGAICILNDNNQLSVYEKLSSYLPRGQRPDMREAVQDAETA